MTDDNNKSVRRVNRKNKDAEHERFMPKRSADFPDFANIDIPDLDNDALESLQKIDGIMRPLVVTPQADRFPTIPTEDDELDVKPKPKPAYRRPKNSRRNNVITLLFMLMTIGVLAYFALLWTDPLTILNPLAPPTPFEIVTATADANPAFVPTMQPTVEQGQPTPTSDLADLYPFAIAPDGVLFVSNQNGRDCNWASIAGTVTNTNGEPLPGFGIRVSGDQVSATVYSGTNQTFGEGGYELNLGGAPMFANFRVRLVTTGGAPLSDEVIVTTRDDCNENVAIVNFIQG